MAPALKDLIYNRLLITQWQISPIIGNLLFELLELLSVHHWGSSLAQPRHPGLCQLPWPHFHQQGCHSVQLQGTPFTQTHGILGNGATHSLYRCTRQLWWLKLDPLMIALPIHNHISGALYSLQEISPPWCQLNQEILFWFPWNILSPLPFTRGVLCWLCELPL